MEEITKNNLENGRFYYKDSECEMFIEKAACGHYAIMVSGLIGIAGMHYDTVKQLLASPIDISKFTYAKFHENEIIEIVPLDKS